MWHPGGTWRISLLGRPRTAVTCMPRRRVAFWPVPKSSHIEICPPPQAWFQSSAPTWSNDTEAQDSGDHKPTDKRTVQLGHTIRTLQERMPTLLQSPLPTDILSPSISLHLFPSTHPDLPIVRGRVAYVAALWTAPVAWGRLPGGGARLEVVSERMVNGETLRIRWRATEGRKEAVDGKEFSGIFLFEFDENGKVYKHIIENTEEDEGRNEVGSVITVTEWLIRKAKGKGDGHLALEFRGLHHGRR